MLTKDSTLYLSGIVYNYYQQDFWNSLEPIVQDGGKFMLNLGKRYKPNRFVSRNGEWSLPWKQEIPPMFRMPTYDPNFSKSFSDVCDERAGDIKNMIASGKKFAIMYSGGLDSTLIMSALIKNLTREELENIVVCCNLHSLIENPIFWKKFIKDKFKLFDSSVIKYDDLIEMGYCPITGDEGDAIFGTMMGHEMMQNYSYYLSKVSSKSRIRLESIKEKQTDPSVHWSKYKDIIIQQFSLGDDAEFGKSWYEKFAKNIKTATVPIQSLHDFYWWMIFNIKYLNCATRISFLLNDRLHCKDLFENKTLNWFNNDGFQLWSMVNNNNGEKIELSPATYKMAARKYIYDLDHNDWYFYFKLKIGSLGVVVYNHNVDHLDKKYRPNARFGLDKNYNTLYIDDPNVQDFIREKMINFKKDW